MKGERRKISNRKEDKSYQMNDVKDEEWEEIKDHIKEKKGKAGKNDKNFLNGVFWILRTGAP